MPIDFTCTQCGKVLRVGDDSAGKQAKCPACGQLSIVPAAAAPPFGAAPAPQGNFSAPPPRISNTPLPQNPFADFTPQGPQNPYQTPPSSAYIPSSVRSSATVKAPAIAILVVAILSIIYSLLYIVVLSVQGLDAVVGPAKSPEERMGQIVGTVIVIILQICLNGTGILGAIQMIRLRNYGLAIAGTVCTMINCTLCCLIGIPLGIWSLVVLLQPDVRAQFR